MPSDDNTNKHDLAAYADDFLKNTVYTEPHFKFSSQGKIQNASSDEPVLTLTYAQSLDGKIAGKNGKQIQLSGKESAVMTHRLRAMHTHIMVGSGTCLNDNPQLNCRLPALLPLDLQPIPVILDTTFKTPVDCKLIQNAKAGIGHFPLILAIGSPQARSEDGKAADDAARRREALLHAGCRIVYGKCADNERYLTPAEITESLGLRSEHSLMIEGGASVISSFLSSTDGHSPCTRLIITIAPTFIGEDGVAPNVRDSQCLKNMVCQSTRTFGRDVVVAYRASKER